jgi:N-acetylglutamate synthase-like GNAT family acetyltransferase
LALLQKIENKAKELGIKRLYSEVSITAKSFFEKHEYKSQSEKTKIWQGVHYINYIMTKDLM